MGVEVDVAALRKVAEGATPGVWKLWGMSVMADQDGTSNVDTAVEVAATFYRDENGKPRTWDADHIATFDPPTVLALLDRLEAAEAHAAELERAVDNVRRFHPRGDEESSDLAPGVYCPGCGEPRADRGDGGCRTRRTMDRR